MTARARSLFAAGFMLPVLAASTRAWADETPPLEAADQPVYVVTPDAVHVVSEQDLPTLHQHPCQPREKLPVYRAPRGVFEHCHGRLYFSGKIIDLASDLEGNAWDRTTPALTGGVAVWGYKPSVGHSLLEFEFGWPTIEFTYDFSFGHSFGVPGPALRGGSSLVVRAMPDYLHTRWELPALELAWVFADGDVAAELGGRAALVLAGRFNLHDSSERLGASMLYGSYGILAHRGARFRTMLVAQLARIEREPPFHELDARLCSGSGVFMICVRAEQRWMALDREWSNLLQASRRATALSLSAAWSEW
jgi:hypothetical protein